MTFLPLAQRELRAASHRRGTYWLRSGFALVAMIISLFVFLAFIDSAPQRAGRHMFRALAWLSMPYCLLCGVRCTADCLSEEKREGTLGLLFLTDLKGYDVILGKLLATSLSGLYGLIAIFPVLATPLLLGGISSQQFWCELLVLLNTFLFSVAVGMLVSVFSRQSRRAMGVTFALVMAFGAALPGVVGLAQLFGFLKRGGIAEVLLLPCPGYALTQTLQASFSPARQPTFFWSVIVVHALTWALLGLASWTVAESWQEKPAEGWKKTWRDWQRRRTFGNTRRRQWLRTKLLGINPVYWAAARARPRGHYWRLLAILGILWFWGSVTVGTDWFNEGIYFPAAILLNCSFKTWVASEAGRYFGEQRKQGALEFVLSTPIRVKEILDGQWLALRHQFLGPLLAVLAVQLIFLAASLQREPFLQNSLNPVLWIASMLMLVADTVALCWTAMWGALTVKSPNVITGVTVTRLLLAPWVLFIIVLIMANLLTAPTSPDFTWKFYLGLWFGLGILLDLAFGLGARRALRRRFRELALRPFVPLSVQVAQFLERLKLHSIACLIPARTKAKKTLASV